jgi:hypothetical protein
MLLVAVLEMESSEAVGWVIRQLVSSDDSSLVGVPGGGGVCLGQVIK